MLLLLYQYWLIHHSGLFNSTYYRQTYLGVDQSGLDPIIHFIKIGWQKGNNPSADFDTVFYLNQNPDVAKSEVNPLIHYIKWGCKEGRYPNAFTTLTYPKYQDWINEFDQLKKTDIELIQSKIRAIKDYPKLTLILPIERFSLTDVKLVLSSLQRQIYNQWKLKIITDQKNVYRLNQSLSKMINKDDRITISICEKNSVLKPKINEEIENSESDFVSIIKPKYKLSEHALYLMIHWLNCFPHANIIYCDEDRMDRKGNRHEPYFKPDWNHDLFLTQNFLSGFTLIRTKTFIRALGLQKDNLDLAIWDLFLRITEVVEPETIQHIPFVLYHELIDNKPINNFDYPESYRKSYKTMVASHLERRGESAEIIINDMISPKISYKLSGSEPMVSIIIPTKDNHKLLSSCLNSIEYLSDYPNKEIVVINNQSVEPETFSYFSQLRTMGNNIRVIDYDQPFNFSAINNFAVKETRGKILIFLNNDIEPLTPNWITELAGHAIRSDIGAVGAMLYYPDDTVQHGGLILLGDRVAGQAYQNYPRGFKGQRYRAVHTQNLSAITGACLAIEKKKFNAIGGFDEALFPIAYNDVDFCLRLLKAGYRNIWTPHAELYHHESASRGYDITPEKKARLNIEAEHMRKKWGIALKCDPAYNPNLSLESALFSLADPPRATKPWLKTNH